MTTTVAPDTLVPFPLECANCGVSHTSDRPAAICPECLGPLEVVYPEGRSLPDRATIAARPPTLWRYREWLPFEGTPLAARDTGWTPLVEAPRVASALGVRRAWLKLDTLSNPSLSFKDRVVTTAINAVRAFGLEAIACASTGNLANAVASAAAREGLPAWIFVPHDLEIAKLVGTLVYGPRLVRVRGTYDDVNRLCAQLADEYPWGIANVNLRAYYGEGSKTMAFEIAEQLEWQLPTAVVAPMAGGSLVTKLRKGFGEFIDAGLVDDALPRVFGAQASGCAPIVRLFERGSGGIVPEVPSTIARSLAIGNPADGVAAARVLRETGGGAAAVSDDEIRDAIRELASLSGVFGETAAGVTYAGAKALARSGALTAKDDVVLCLTGNGLKTAEALTADLDQVPTIAPRLREVEALVS
ncbi:MAG: threonine synthase [Gemmatimonadaceae bacterium]|nr:threonine synthase [Gemmatimonadaceae bacterium]